MHFSKSSSKVFSSLPSSWNLLLCNWESLGLRICQTPFTLDTHVLYLTSFFPFTPDRGSQSKSLHTTLLLFP